MKSRRKIVLAVAGSSGSIYAKRMMEKLKELDVTVGVVMSDNAIINWQLENGDFDANRYPFDFYDSKDFNAPFASGSAKYDSMIICPCSMGVIGRIANGISTDLMTRAADVMLKERRKLVVLPRESPFNLIHLRNMTTITEAGGIICPAIPSFYSNPQTMDDLADTVVDRVLDLIDIDVRSFRWGEMSEAALVGSE